MAKKVRNTRNNKAVKAGAKVAVKAAQTLMNRFGFTDKQGNKLKEDGVKGKKTTESFKKLERYQKESERPSTKTKMLQTELNKSGIKAQDGKPLKIDGVLGPMTDMLKNKVKNVFAGRLEDSDYKDRTVPDKVFPKMPKIGKEDVDNILKGDWAELREGFMKDSLSGIAEKIKDGLSGIEEGKEEERSNLENIFEVLKREDGQWGFDSEKTEEEKPKRGISGSRNEDGTWNIHFEQEENPDGFLKGSGVQGILKEGEKFEVGKDKNGDLTIEKKPENRLEQEGDGYESLPAVMRYPGSTKINPETGLPELNEKTFEDGKLGLARPYDSDENATQTMEWNFEKHGGNKKMLEILQKSGLEGLVDGVIGKKEGTAANAILKQYIGTGKEQEDVNELESLFAGAAGVNKENVKLMSNSTPQTQKPKTSTELAGLSREDLARRGIDYRALSPFGGTEKPIEDPPTVFTNEEREAKAKEILDNATIVMPGDIGTDEKVPMTPEERIQQLIDSSNFMNIEMKDIKKFEELEDGKIKEFEIAAAMLAHANNSNGEPLPDGLQKALSNEVAASSKFQDRVKEMIQNSGGASSFDTGEEGMNFYGEGNNLELSLGEATVRVRGTKMEDGNWMIEFGGKDVYDYSTLRYGLDSPLPKLANNWAYEMQGIGFLKPYPVTFGAAFIYKPE